MKSFLLYRRMLPIWTLSIHSFSSSCRAKFGNQTVVMPISWDYTTMFAFFLAIQATPHLMTHVYPGRVRSWLRLRTAKPQPSLPGPSLDLHNGPAQRASRRLQWHHTSKEHSLNSDDLSRVLSSPMWTHGEERDRMFWRRGQFCDHLSIRNLPQVTQASAY